MSELQADLQPEPTPKKRGPKPKVEQAQAQGLKICTVKKVASFWRCKRNFGPNPLVIPLSELSEADAERLCAEPKLKVELVDL